MSRIPRAPQIKTQSSRQVVRSDGPSNIPSGLSRVTEVSRRDPKSGLGRQLGTVKPEEPLPKVSITFENSTTD